MSFLNAEWRKLLIVNYEIDPNILKPYIPKGTELDIWNDKCYLSVVGFMFLNTRILGVKIPFHINFEEVNLRFYVKRKVGSEWRRGVVFIKEIVPKKAISVIANSVYNENYITLPMKHDIRQTNELFVQYQWKFEQEWFGIKVSASNESKRIAVDSEEEFITEHYWGYTKKNDSSTYEYEVGHPRWKSYSIIGYSVDLNFSKMYGSDFEGLNHQTPVSVILAEGSEINVEKAKVFHL
ncbi:MAG: DUF2071 domain-containing protein [Flavobacteriales bacterium]|nr:DUF2071 domain-containing protein [Flavobacteriales bacterium]